MLARRFCSLDDEIGSFRACIHLLNWESVISPKFRLGLGLRMARDNIIL
jgi:hypothetical protein